MLLRSALVAAAVALFATGATAQTPRVKPKARIVPAPAALLLPPAPTPGGSDSCATPDAIFGTGLFAFDDTNATTGLEGQSESLCHQFGNPAILSDVWFLWTAPISGTARVTTVNHTIVDTKLAAYAGGACPLPNTALACNDDDTGSFSYQSTITFRCTAGNAYMLQVGTFPGPFPPPIPGQGSISITISAPPANDVCSSAQIVGGFGAGATHAFDTTLATMGAEGQNNAACESFATRAIDGDVWFRWTAVTTEWVHVTTCSAAGDTKIAVYAGAGCPSAEAIVCDDDGCGAYAGASDARFFAVNGATYSIQLGSFPGQPGTSGVFTIEPFAPAIGDSCSAPIPIAGRGPHAFDNRAATTGLEGQTDLLCTTPLDSNPRITYDTWYAWTAPGSGSATWSLCSGSTMDSKIAVWSGSACPVTPSLACSDSGCATSGQAQVVFPVTAGATYLLQLGNWPGGVADVGTFTLDVTGSVGTAFCFGSGSGTSCPCSPAPIAPGVASNGCPNSDFAGGANLRAEGNASVANDSLVLHGTGMPNGPCLYFQGTAQQSAGAGLPFGDGLFCAGGTIIRLGVKFNTNGWSANPSGGSPGVSSAGFVAGSGGTRTYQIWYRNANAYCTAATFNLTNGVQVDWTP